METVQKISANIEALKTTVSAISEYVEIATLRLESDGLKFYGMDKEHVSLTTIFLERGTSISYEVETSFSVNTKEFLKALKSFKVRKWGPSTVNIELGNKVMAIKFDNQPEQKIIFYEPVTGNMPIPKLLIPSKLILGKEAAKTIVALEPLSEYLTFITNKYVQTFKVHTKNDVLKSLEAEIKYVHYLDNYNIENAESSFTMEYLTPILKVFNKQEQTDYLDLELGTKVPLRITFNVQQNTQSKIVFYLAPRIQY